MVILAHIAINGGSLLSVSIPHLYVYLLQLRLKIMVKDHYKINMFLDTIYLYIFNS